MSDKIGQLFHSLLKTAVSHGVSDVHLRVGKKPYFRQKGGLVALNGPELTEQDITKICYFIIKEESVRKNLAHIKEHDGSYQLKGICRVRYNLMRYQGKIGLVFRIIVLEVPTIEKLKLKPVIAKIAESRRGLVLVTGATGSGKSSTLAAMIEYINQTRSDHILTIEDPVEFVYQSKKSLITQREIGSDSENFKDALRGALRQDPDIILIGEMRDPETVNIAVKAAETGHLVFATVHTTNALTTIGRIVSMFPPDEQKEVKRRLADNLQATISQRLLPTKTGKGRICLQEIMVNSPGIKECIIGKEPLENMYIFIESGYRDGSSQSFDQELVSLVQKDQITFEAGLEAASSPTNFERALEFGKEGGKGYRSNFKKKKDPSLELEVREKPPAEEKENSEADTDETPPGVDYFAKKESA